MTIEQEIVEILKNKMKTKEEKLEELSKLVRSLEDGECSAYEHEIAQALRTIYEILQLS